MAAVSWERVAWERQHERVARQRRPLRLVTAPPSRRRPDAHVLRRRRLVALTVALALTAFLAAGVSHVVRASASGGSVPAAPVVLVAQPGDSYWMLADQIHDGGDLRSDVDELVAANGGRELHAGDQIVLEP
jgi:hypothetical protein